MERKLCNEEGNSHKTANGVALGVFLAVAMAIEGVSCIKRCKNGIIIYDVNAETVANSTIGGIKMPES